MARQYLQRERPDHTLQSTALVHEAYVRLIGQKLPEWQNRAHFFGVAARLMRQILVEYARSHQAAKRGGSACKVTLDEDLMLPQQHNVTSFSLTMPYWIWRNSTPNRAAS